MSKDIVAYNLSRREAVTDDNKVCQITKMYDINGRLTNDPSECKAFVAKLDEDNWFQVDTTKYMGITIH